MKYQSFLIKYAEIGTKGKNRFMFEDALIKQIRYALKSVEGRFEAVSYTHLPGNGNDAGVVPGQGVFPEPV